ncbi:MAG: aldehyde dehydrogenase family protein [Polyangiales bacterium]
MESQSTSGGGQFLEVDNPFSHDLAARVRLASWADVERVLDAARQGAQAIAACSIDERVALCTRAVAAMERDAEPIAVEISQQMGKPLQQARNEVVGMVKRAQHMCAIAANSLADVVIEPAEPGLERRIVRTPLGVVFNLPAWNYPLLTAINVVVPAVLAGNAVIVKHSPRTPLTGDRFAKAFDSAGAPQGVVQSLHCDHATSERIVGDPRIAHVAFTGSVYGGHRIQQAAAHRFLEVGLELGGNDAAYVAHDCDFAATVEGIVDGACYNTGQSCCAVERVYVHESIYQRFVEACIAPMRAYVLGNPMDATITMGPIAQPLHPAALDAQVRDAVSRGARLLLGGAQTRIDGKGRFFQPTLLADVDDQADVMRLESFGPLLPVTKVKSDEEALAKMNDDDLGLTASVWTRDRERALRFATALAVGTVYMNRCDALDAALPWTGVKDSGKGSTLGAIGLHHLTRPKALNFRLR